MSSPCEAQAHERTPPHPEGEPLPRLLSAPWPLAPFLRVAIGMATALGRLHAQGLMHGDLWPAHFRVDRDTGAAWLTGSGVALPRQPRLPGADSAPSAVDQLLYMAPEQTGRLNRPVDARSDLYALGVCLYQMLTGSLPFASNNPMELVHAHVARTPEPPAHRVPQVPSVLSALVLRLLAKGADERYQTAAGLVADLRRCQRASRDGGHIESFVLGAADVSSRLLMPERLYGREAEAQAMHAALRAVANDGTSRLVLIAGPPGIGKSSLVADLRRTLSPAAVLFAEGKADPQQCDTPYGSLAQAMQGLLRMVLGQPAAELPAWQAALRDALGADGEVLAAVLPDLEHLLGPQSPQPALTAQDRQSHFQRVFQRLLQVFARPGKPLLLCLDDLQWQDHATLELLQQLALAGGLRNLLLVATCRDDAEGAPALSRFLPAWRAGLTPLSELTLRPLAPVDLGQLVADALSCQLQEATGLATLVHQRTDGNPYFAAQFMAGLAEQGLLAFDSESCAWTWDLQRIAQEARVDNVIGLMVGKVARLPEATQAALQQLAGLGTTAPLALMGAACGLDEAGLQAALWPAVDFGMLRIQSNQASFAHDRVREAAYALVTDDARPELHLSLARLLLQTLGDSADASNLFALAQQFNLGAERITSQDERDQVARVNLRAARQAKAAGASAAALKHADAGLGLLGLLRFQRQPALALELQLLRAECALLGGATESAERDLAELQALRLPRNDNAAVCRQLMMLQVMRSDYAPAVNTALQALRDFGIELAPHPLPLQVQRVYAEVMALLEQRDIESLVELPLCDDAEVTAAMGVLSELFAPACFTDGALALLHLCEMVRLSLRKGLTPASAHGFGWFGILIGQQFGHYSDGYRFAALAHQLVQRHGQTAFEAKALFALEIASVWAQPMATALATSRAAFAAAVERGDLAVACFACHHSVNDMLLRGDPLDAVEREIETGLAFVRRAGFDDVIDELLTQQRFVRSLRGQTIALGVFDGDDFDEEAFERRLTPKRMPTMIYWYWVMKAQARFIAGRPDEAGAALARARPLQWSAVHVQVLNCELFMALVAVDARDGHEDGDASGLGARLRGHRAQLLRWQMHNPATLNDKLALVDAELARAEGRWLDAERHFEQAIGHARSQGALPYEALASERAGGFYLARGLTVVGEGLMRHARDIYRRWGAIGKASQLEDRYADLREQTAGPDSKPATSALEPLDLSTVMKVSQAIAGEVELQRLFDTLMRLALEHAGAERAMLVLPAGEQMLVQAVASLAADGIEVEHAGAGRHAAELPSTLLQYVANCKQHVLLDDAMAANPFSADDTLRRRRLRSVLCLPLLKQARLVGVLYLENNLLTHAFTPDRLALLELLASQAASALENANLYEALTRENQERRAAVAESQRINEALQDSEGRFRRMAETTPDVIWITDLEPERVLYVSPSFERIWGFKVQDLYHDPRLWTASIDDADRERIHDAFGRWIGGKSPGQWEAEYRIRRPDGELRWIHERGSVIADARGRPRRVSGISTDITARRHAEAALRASEERFALAVAGSNDGIWDLDLVTGQMFMSEQAQRLHGLEVGPEERTLTEWRAAMKFHPDDAPRQSEMFEAYLAGQVPSYDGEWRVQLPDGQDRWVRIRGLCLRDSNGQASRAAGSVIDIDAQKRIEVALRKSEQRYALAMQASQDGNFDWDLVTDEYYVSPRAVEIYGLGPDFQYRGRDDCLRQVPFASEAARAEWVRVVAAHFASRETRLDTDVQVRRQGEVRWVHVTGLLVRDGEGRPLRWTGSLSDVTVRKLSEEALRKSEERFALAVAGSNDGIWDWDTQSGRMFMSERAQRIYGLEPDSTMRLRDEWLALLQLHPEDVAEQEEAIQSYLDGRAPHYDGEWRVGRADGSYRWVRVRGLCVRDDSGTPLRLAGSVSDIDAHKRAQASLQQAQRLEAVGTLASGIAHDFNNILGAILGFGEISLRNTRAGSRMRRDLECIMTAGERGRALVERVLAFSRSGSGERVAVHVEGVVREALTLLTATLPAGVKLRMQLAGGAAAMLGDATQVHQVVVNLATNAVQAMPNGGLLSVTLQTATLVAPRLATTGTLPVGDYLLLTVSDTGSGIAEDVRERIFDPFVTTKKVGAGSGLGLSLVHGIVTEVGGAVDVATAAGEGSTFTVYLPRTGEAAERGNDQLPVVPRGRHQQVLVVDDEELLLRLSTETLIELGYVAVGFTSSSEALAAFSAHPERFDAVLSDERMPDMPGTTLIQALRTLRPSIPVLLMTGYLGAEVHARARAAGVKAIMGKPVSRRDLAAAMAMALQEAPAPTAAPDQRLRRPQPATRRR